MSDGRNGTVLTQDDVPDMVPVTNPFLKEMLQEFLRVGERKHGVDFELAATVFRDPLMQSVPDPEHGGFEERWITIGCIPDGRLLVVSHTFAETGSDKTSVRIISARPMTRNERRQYEEGE